MSDSSMLTLREKRKALDVSQIELERIMGISPTIIADYERGRRKSMGIILLRRVVLAMLALPDLKK